MVLSGLGMDTDNQKKDREERTMLDSEKSARYQIAGRWNTEYENRKKKKKVLEEDLLSSEAIRSCLDGELTLRIDGELRKKDAPSITGRTRQSSRERAGVSILMEGRRTILPKREEFLKTSKGSGAGEAKKAYDARKKKGWL